MEKLRQLLLTMGLDHDDSTIEKFQTYMEDIIEWNDKVNLTNILDKDEFVVKHYMDSIISCNLPEYVNSNKIIDVGTGAGFPGIPLALVSKDKEFYLMDSLLKRLKIIDEECKKLEINNVATIHARAEELAKDKEHREQYDLCVSRAVANLATLSEYCLPFIKVGGYLIAYKGPEADNEVNDAKKAIKILGGKVVEIKEANLDEFDIHHKLVIIEKVASTPGKYPRKAGTPAKEPIR